MEKLKSLSDMVHVLPAQTHLWQRVEAAARDLFRRAMVREIRNPPLLEVTELFARGIGEATDVVGKET